MTRATLARSPAAETGTIVSLLYIHLAPHGLPLGSEPGIEFILVTSDTVPGTIEAVVVSVGNTIQI